MERQLTGKLEAYLSCYAAGCPRHYTTPSSSTTRSPDSEIGQSKSWRQHCPHWEDGSACDVSVSEFTRHMLVQVSAAEDGYDMPCVKEEDAKLLEINWPILS